MASKLQLSPTVIHLQPQAKPDHEQEKRRVVWGRNMGLVVGPAVANSLGSLKPKLPTPSPRCSQYRTLNLGDIRGKIVALYKEQTKTTAAFKDIVETLSKEELSLKTLAVKVGAKFKNLHTLDLPNIDPKTLVVITKLFTHCSKKLTHLNIRNSPDVTDENLQLIAVHFNELVELNMEDCAKVSDKGFESVVTKLRNLVYLDIHGATGITAAGTAHIVTAQEEGPWPRLSCIRF